MPQGRRKVPFSTKRKKEQLIAKRQTKASRNFLKTSNGSDDNAETTSSSDNVQKLNLRPVDKGRGNRYALHFHKESKKELLQMKLEAKDPFHYVDPAERQIDGKYFEDYDFPIRPKWHYGMSKEELNRNENRYFTEYVQRLEKLHNERNKMLSLFELNLETWRQLWRVLEISDILLVIVDVRYPALMFPPSLYSYVTKELNKNVILVINKIDLVKPEVVIAWKNFFIETYPGITVVFFASYATNNSHNLKVTKRYANKKKGAECALNIFKQVKTIVKDDLDLTKWEDKIHYDMAAERSDRVSDSEIEGSRNQSNVPTHTENYDFTFESHEKYKNGVLTIGCVGFPNVGKSSIINALKGQKVVSVSRTPGHTKHFQTIFLTDNVKLCDCPGLVFPSSTPKYLQVLLGSYPLAQLREPYGSIRYVGERIDLPKILSIELPVDYTEWSAIGICEAWALKKGFLTAKAARPDFYRAANNILRLAIEGKIVLEFFPPNYFADEDKWRKNYDYDYVVHLQTPDKVAEPGEAHYCSPSDTESESIAEENASDESSEEDEVQKASSNPFDLLNEE